MPNRGVDEDPLTASDYVNYTEDVTTLPTVTSKQMHMAAGEDPLTGSDYVNYTEDVTILPAVTSNKMYRGGFNTSISHIFQNPAQHGIDFCSIAW